MPKFWILDKGQVVFVGREEQTEKEKEQKQEKTKAQEIKALQELRQC